MSSPLPSTDPQAAQRLYLAEKDLASKDALIQELVTVLNKTHRHVAGRNPALCDEMFAVLRTARAQGFEP